MTNQHTCYLCKQKFTGRLGRLRMYEEDFNIFCEGCEYEKEKIKPFTIVVSSWIEDREEGTEYKRLFIPVYCSSYQHADDLVDMMFPHMTYSNNMNVNVISGHVKDGDIFEV